MLLMTTVHKLLFIISCYKGYFISKEQSMIDGIYKPVYATFNITDIMCKILYNSYKRALSIFNDIHSDEKKE